jgi:CRISPR/Cas system Type II protein with McrA/HNH and RuvC-like nuclease domain
MIRTFYGFLNIYNKKLMKEQILKLREGGKTYNEIMKILGCSKSTISYYCGENQKEKSKNRRNKRRENILLVKVERFKHRKQKEIQVLEKDIKTRKDVVESIRKFQKRENGVSSDGINKELPLTFTWENVLEKFGENTVCYLSGKPINLYVNNYNLDHIVPSSKGGDNSLNNMGITHEIVNKMKGDLTPEELINWCITILEHNGYKVTK